jgi:hypothetical protein
MTFSKPNWSKRLLLQMSLALGATAGFKPSSWASDKALQFAAIGDLPYSDSAESTLQMVLEDIARTDCQFVIHVGDLKGSSEACSNELFARRVALMQASPLPLFYVPGDNEWVDCTKAPNGESYQPEERLNRIRSLAMQGPQSLGLRKLKLERQSDLTPDGLPENTRWLAGSVAFVTINLAGSFNGVGQKNIDQALRVKRDTACAQWLAAFAPWAAQAKANQLVVVWHANPDWNAWPDSDAIRNTKRQAFNHAKAGLESLAALWNGPVLVIHGDSHRFQFDRPWSSLAPRLQRLEVFGSPFVSSWAKVTVGATDTQFSVRPLSIGRH